MKNTCCVPDCRSKRDSVMLHRFPKTEKGLQKWVESINSARLKKYNVKELRTMFVCHKHFEKKFVTGSSRLKQSAYPTLFSNEELDTGIPTFALDNNGNMNDSVDRDYRQTGKRTHSDHSYCREPLRDLQSETNVSYSNIPPTLSFENQTFNEVTHLADTNSPSCSETLGVFLEDKDGPVIADSNIPPTDSLENQTFNEETHLADTNSPSCSETFEVFLEDKNEPVIADSNISPTLSFENQTFNEVTHLADTNSTSCSKSLEVNTSKEILKDNDDPVIAESSCPVVPKKALNKPHCTKQGMTLMYQQLLRKYKKAKRQLNFAVRAKKAMKCSKKSMFEKLTKNLEPVAKKILWMQISQSTKQTKGRRFSEEEKLVALAIMKQSPENYKFLRRIFILPTVRIINKMIASLKMKSGINVE